MGAPAFVTDRAALGDGGMETPLYDFLRGTWSVNRRIEDRLGGGEGRFAGTARFEGETTLAYREAGMLEVGGAAYPAERRYRWECGIAGAEVRHGDGSPFHAFTVTDGAASARHLCGDDLYRGTYRFDAEGWRVVWIVTGPRKDYTSVTEYRR